ncbi:MAG: sigma 54-interacting transcriptional regulator, partial [Thermodesulfobacteriota bacterium]
MNVQDKNKAKESKFEKEHLSLFNLSRMINAERDLNILLDFLVNESSKLVDADRATLFLLDDKTNQLWSHLALGTSEIIRFDAKLGIAGESLSTGKTINVQDAYNYTKFYPEIDKRTGYRTRSILCVPLKDLKGKAIGVLQTLNKKDGKFTKKDEETLEIFASNAAVAIENAKLIKELENAKSRIQQENVVLRDKVKGRFFTSDIIGSSRIIQEVANLIEKISDSPINVLITGESGTGKELAARMIHFNSSRSEKPFIDINCAALPESLLESELFGIEKGVATGVESREGKFEMANSGTLFLDEVGDMSLPAQAKLLRVLQERRLKRVGGKKDIDVDVRVIAATNKDLINEINKENFREDLYYRLNVIHIHMPSLREIKEDIPVLAKHFLDNFTSELGRGPTRFSQKTMNYMVNYNWPGNVRELENEIKRAVILSESDEIRETDLSDNLKNRIQAMDYSLGDSASNENKTLKDTVEEIEIKMINDALDKTGGNKQKASEIL